MSSVDRFVEEMGLMFQQAGDPRIAGRIFGLLVIEGRELSLQQLSEKLGVSRASVSTNARRMAKRGVIRLTAHPGDRQDFYELNNFPSVDVIGEMAERVIHQARTVQAFVAPLRTENTAASERVEDLSKVLDQAARMLTDWAAALHNEQTIRKDPE
ncbi:GbsR/MarR family transcriptional regulator [Devosia ginsengisoli]|uniref:GbsR/MarR family transcriptional regulator n=1 Tax=Devosia ginsengisoli TaxID=400770 RepID=UPI0016486796|nr:MarR family transcriptional regulator [Devosia ginsengisoli]